MPAVSRRCAASHPTSSSAKPGHESLSLQARSVTPHPGTVQLEQHWAKSGPRAIHGRALRFDTLLLDPARPLASTRANTVFVAVGVQGGQGNVAFRILDAAGIPIVAPRAEVPADIDAVRLIAGERDLQERLSEFVRAAGLEIRETPASVPRDSNAAIVITGDEAALKSFASTAPTLSGRRVILTLPLARRAPEAVAAILERGAELYALRAVGDLSDASLFAAVIANILNRALIDVGRDLARSRFSAVLRRLSLSVDGWPPMDFSRNPASDAVDVVCFKYVR